MARLPDITGNVYGRLVVLEEVPERNRFGHTMAKCQCECGNVKIFRKHLLTDGTTRSCGCLRVETRRKTAGEVSKACRYVHYKNSARRRGYEFTITKEYFTYLSSLPCDYCGELPKPHNRYYKKDGSLRAGRTSRVSADRAWININGVDRIINDIGYIEGNCVPCCYECNESKMARSVNDFISHAYKIVAHQELLKTRKAV